MRRAVPAAIAIVLYIVIATRSPATPLPGAVDSSTKSEPAHCADNKGFKSCAGPGRIEVSAERTSEPAPASDGDRSSVEPPGSFRFVRCGVDTASQLRANGQAAEMATFYAEGCNNWTQGCNAVAQPNGQPEQASVRLIKLADGSWSFNGSICQQVAVAGPPRITPLMVWEQARRLISAAPIGLAPRARTLVNIETIMWVNTVAARMLPSVVLFGQRVSIHITIDHVVWAFGDGRTDTGEGPGKPYDPHGDPCPTKQCPGYFGHVYTTTGQMTITATVTWRATFRVGGGAVTPIPGTIAGPSATARILVREARSVLVPDPTPS
jgi:hypothetical protein